MGPKILNYLLGAILGFIQSPLRNAITEAVATAENSQLTGEDKKNQVISTLYKLQGPLLDMVMATAGFLLNLAIEAAVARLKIAQGKYPG